MGFFSEIQKGLSSLNRYLDTKEVSPDFYKNKRKNIG